MTENAIDPTPLQKIIKLRELMELPWENEYRVFKIPQECGGGYCGYVENLGRTACRSDGNTPEEAIKNLKYSIEFILEVYIENGIEPPLPRKCWAACNGCQDNRD